MSRLHFFHFISISGWGRLPFVHTFQWALLNLAYEERIERMLSSLSPRLQIHQMVPPFTLRSGQGKEVKLWDYKMRKNLVILFHHGSNCSVCREKLKDFADHYREFAELETEILAISSGDEEDTEMLRTELDLPYPLLSDPEGRTTEKYTYWQRGNRVPLPSVFVTDRYGMLVFQQIADEITGLPDRKEILSWLNFIQSQCPECSV